MKYLIQSDRTRLVDLAMGRLSVSGEGRSIENLTTKDIASHQINYVFGEKFPEAGDLPTLILVPNGEEADFLAWTSTYLPHLCPLSALCRVMQVGDPLLQYVLGDEVNPSVPSRIVLAYAGAVVADALAEWREGGQQGTPSALTCESTLSFAIARAAMLYPMAAALQVAQLWEQAQFSVNSKRLHGRWDSTSTWTAILQSCQGTPTRIRPAEEHRGLSRVLRAIIEASGTGARIWSDLLLDQPTLFPFAAAASSREDQVRALERVAAGGPASVLDTLGLSRGALLALLAARLSDTVLSHYDLLSDLTNGDRDALILYGFISGAVTEQRGGRFDSLQQRVVRDLRRSPGLGQPTDADVSINELLVLARAETGFPRSLCISGAHLIIELMPGVSTFARWSSTSTAASSGREELKPEDELLADIDRLDKLTAHLRQVGQRLKTSLGRRKRERYGRGKKQ